MSSPLIGKTIGHYKISDPVGAGGMGVVYRAQDLKLGRMVALKVLPPGANATEEATERFKREARTASSLNHPNICTIYGFDEVDGQLYLAMELLEGEPLDKRLTERPLELGQVLDIAAQVCDALDAAHSSGILHRDIKPANIFLTRRGVVKVLDFGLAKLSPGSRRSSLDVDAAHETVAQEHFTSMAGTTVGTIAYMSPEQARAEEVDSRTDLFSLGVVLYEMITGRQSFPGGSTAVIFDGILNRDPAPPSSINPNIPPELDRIVAKALEKDRTLRYQTAADLGADIKRLRRDSSSRRVPAAAGAMSGSETNIIPPASQSPSSAHPPSYGSAGSVPTAASSKAASASSGASLPVRTRSPWLIGGGLVATVAVAIAIAFASAAYIARLDNPPPTDEASSDATAATSSAVPVPGQAAPATPTPAPTPSSDVSATPAASQPSPTSGSLPSDAATTAAGSATTDSSKGSTAAGKLPAKGAPAASGAPAGRTAEAQQRLDIAKAKISNNLNEPALTDLHAIIADYSSTPAAAEASLISADLLEKMNRIDDAMAALVEFESRFASDPRVAVSKLRRAQMVGRTRQPRAELQSRALLNEVVRDFPGTPQAAQALAVKMKLETDRKEIKDMDPVLKTEVPAIMVTLRSIIEQFPTQSQSVVAYNRLAAMYSDMDKYAEAAQVLESLGANVSGNPMDVWFRLGELYERRLNDAARAKAAYAKVPSDSPKYGDAQRRLRR